MQFLGGGAGDHVAAELDALHLPQATVRTAGVTRTATTLLSRRPGAVYAETELINPSPEILPSEADAFVRAVENTVLDSQRIAAAAVVSCRPGLAIMGTCPGGATDDLYVRCLRAATSAIARGQAGSDPAALVTLLDGYRGIDGVLASGLVSVLKINYKELCQLLAADGAAPEPATLEAWAQQQSGDGNALSRLLGRWQVGALAVTDGGRPAFLAVRLADNRVAAYLFDLPADVAVVNAIGSGDATAAAMLASLLGAVDPCAQKAQGSEASLVAGLPVEALVAAMVAGLATATAAVQTAHPDDFEPGSVARWANEVMPRRLL